MSEGPPGANHFSAVAKHANLQADTKIRKEAASTVQAMFWITTGNWPVEFIKLSRLRKTNPPGFNAPEDFHSFKNGTTPIYFDTFKIAAQKNGWLILQAAHNANPQALESMWAESVIFTYALLENKHRDKQDIRDS